MDHKPRATPTGRERKHELPERPPKKPFDAKPSSQHARSRSNSSFPEDTATEILSGLGPTDEPIPPPRMKKVAIRSTLSSNAKVFVPMKGKENNVSCEFKAASSKDSRNEVKHINRGLVYEAHSFYVGNSLFTVDQRYSMIDVLGHGSFGVVISASDKKAPFVNVAIKLIPNFVQDAGVKMLREIKLLKHFGPHDNIITLLDMMPPNVQYLDDFNQVYMVTDLMERNLQTVIDNHLYTITTEHVRWLIYQLLRGLKYIHSCNVIHRDIKPENLLVNSNCDLKICDFGLARGIQWKLDGRHDTMYLTEYVVTRWYRAPEILLESREYSFPIDVWSVGCIFAELILRYPLFPGHGAVHQVRQRYHLYFQMTTRESNKAFHYAIYLIDTTYL